MGRPEVCRFVTEEQENEHELCHYWNQEGGVRREYEEMVVQFGFIALFSVGFMLAPLMGLLNNLIERVSARCDAV